MKRVYLILSSAMPLTLAEATEIDFGYDSKYVSEGRDNLPGSAIVWSSIAHELSEKISVSAAYGVATDANTDYDELNLSLEYGQEFDQFAYSLSYTRLEFFKDNQSDNEIGLVGSWLGFDSFVPGFNLVYSTEARGTFLELSVETEWVLATDWTLSPYVKVAFDFGYANDRFDGHNHSSLGANLRYQISEQWSVSTIVEHNLGGEVMKKLLGDGNDQTWAGLHFTASF